MVKIIAALDRYAELKAQADQLDRLTYTNTPHDVAEYLGARYELPRLEDALLNAGMFRQTAGQVVALVSLKGDQE